MANVRLVKAEAMRLAKLAAEAEKSDFSVTCFGRKVRRDNTADRLRDPGDGRIFCEHEMDFVFHRNRLARALLFIRPADDGHKCRK